MRKFRFSSNVSDPRVLCVSNREFAPVISRCLRYEFEDLIGAMDAVDVIAPADTPDPDNAHNAVQKGISNFGGWRRSLIGGWTRR